jgi:hypothetical protein
MTCVRQAGRFLLCQAKRVPATSVFVTCEGFETSFHLFQHLNPGAPNTIHDYVA